MTTFSRIASPEVTIRFFEPTRSLVSVPMSGLILYYELGEPLIRPI